MALINYKNADICQSEGQLVLEHVDFHVEEGEFVYLIGRVGSGKSSLLKTIYLELNIDEADEATVLDYDLRSLRRKDVPGLRREMGIIFQDFQLLGDRSVKKNLEFVLKATGWKDREKREARINEVLEAVELSDKADKMPHELSGGEQQRTAIARTILNHPKMIIADEPTGNLDAETANNILGLLRQISQTGTAVIMSTHNIPLLDKYPGTVYCCADHQLKEVTNELNNNKKETEI